MPTIRDLINRVRYEVSGQREAEQGPERVKEQLQKATDAANNFIVKARVIGQGLQEIGRIGKGILDGLILNFTTSTDEAAKTARAVGVTVGQLQQLNYAATLSGATSKDVSNALTKLAVGAREASKGTKTFKQAFKDLGVAYVDGNGKLRQTNDLMLDVADRFKGLKDGSQKTALAVKLFGKSGAALVPFLSEGREGLEKMGADARRLGIVLDDQAAKKAENLNDQLFRFKSSLQGVRNAFVLQLLPALTDSLKRFANWISEGDRAQRIVKGITAVAKIAATAILAIASKKALLAIGAFGKALIGVGGRAALLLGPLLLLTTVVSDLFKLFTGGESEIAKALGPGGAEELKQVMQEIFGIFKGLARDLAPALVQLLRAVAPILPYVAKIVAFLAEAVAFVIKGLVKGFKIIAPIVADIAKFLGKVFLVAVDLIAGAVEKIKAGFEVVGRVVRAVAGVIKSVWDSTIGRIIDLVGSLIDKLGGVKRIVEFILIPFRAIQSAIARIVKFFEDAFGFISGLVSKVKSAIGLGGGDDVTGSASRFSAPTPTAAPGEAGPTTVTINNQQTVNAAPGMSAEDVGRIATEQAGTVFQDRIREAVRRRRP